MLLSIGRAFNVICVDLVMWGTNLGVFFFHSIWKRMHMDSFFVVPFEAAMNEFNGKVFPIIIANSEAEIFINISLWRHI